MLSPFQAVVLGIVQGLTEFLPVSSTAHLVLFPWLFGWPDPGQTFDVALHAGTLVALIAYFWSDWVDMIGRDQKRLGLVVLGCIPAGLVGFLFEKRIDRFSDPMQSRIAPLVIAGCLAAGGLLLYWVDHRGSKRRGIDQLDVQDAGLIGLGQALALFPGVSRSGSTITAGLWLGLTREAAARFSFLLSAPIVAGAVVLKTHHMLKEGVPPGAATPMALGIAASAVSGYFVVRFLMQYVKRHRYDGFAVYRVLLAAAIVGVYLIRR